ncbi:MAG: hypothetical protein ACLSVD_07105 [Eggerthellaceae bacterium]
MALIAPLPFCALGVLSRRHSWHGRDRGVATYLSNLVRAHDARRHRAHLRPVANIDGRSCVGAGAAVPRRAWWRRCATRVALALLRPRGAGLFDAWSDGVDAPGFAEGWRGDHLDGCEFVDGSCGAGADHCGSGRLRHRIPVLLQLGAGIALYSSAAWFAFRRRDLLRRVALGVGRPACPWSGQALGAFG